MAVLQPFSLLAKLLFATDDGKPQVEHTAQGDGQFTTLAAGTLTVLGASTTPVPFGTTPAAGAKAVQLEYLADAVNLQPIQVTFNGGTDQMEISPGGSITYHNPNPVAGLTGMTLAHTTNGTVNYRVLG